MTWHTGAVTGDRLSKRLHASGSGYLFSHNFKKSACDLSLHMIVLWMSIVTTSSRTTFPDISVFHKKIRQKNKT